MTAILLEAADIRYRRYGNGQARRCLFFIPGFGDSADGFERFIAHALSIGDKVITIDLPGCGSNADVIVDVERIPHVIHEIVRREALSANAIAAHSLGGLFALRVADQFPDCLIAGLFLIEATLLEPDHNFFLSLDITCADPVKKYAAALNASVVPVSYLSQYKQNVRSMSREMFTFYTQNVAKNLPLERERLLSLSMSMMYLFGSESPAQAEREALAARPHLVVKRIANSGHWPHINEADEVLAYWQAFLASV
ncbi:MAG: alpha/beta hydrolase [Chloroflexota bacterium]